MPVTQLDLISRYTAPGDGERVKLSKLGGDAWNKTQKCRVRKATQEMAKELIALYARRQQAQGYAFPEDNEWQRDFETRFEYDETADQLTSAAEIKKGTWKSPTRWTACCAATWAWARPKWPCAPPSSA